MAANPQSSTTAFFGIKKEAKVLFSFQEGIQICLAGRVFAGFRGVLLGDGTYAHVCVCFILMTGSPISPIK